VTGAPASPLFWYYAIALVIPFANRSWTDSAGFFEHAVFVALVPLAMAAAAALVRAGVRAVFSVGK
jgi:hypothetical protein